MFATRSAVAIAGTFAAVGALEALGPKLGTLFPGQARKQPTPADAVKSVAMRQGKGAEPEPVAGLEDRKIKGPPGESPLRIYWPSSSKGGALPVVHSIHGSGWVIAVPPEHKSAR